VTLPKSLYFNLITKLKAQGYSIVLPKDFQAIGKVAVLRHDVDVQTQGVEAFVEVERMQNVRSAFYLRPHMNYFPQNIERFQKLEQNGWEVGLHYDCLSQCSGNRELAENLFAGQVEFMRRFFKVQSTTHHGDNHNTINNADFYNLQLWTQLNLRDFSAIPNASIVQDTWNRWHEPKEFGDVVLVLTHADWW
jgi:hypothetical protein